MNPSGGLLWHWRAWRSQTLWRETCQQIASWLAQVKPRSSELLLVGASAGWMMPSEWLQRFTKVTVWDIDPMAAPPFRWRHGQALKASGTQLICHTADAISALRPLLNSQPKACVLFDNVLGQVRFHCADEYQAAEKIQQLILTLSGREWGSLHDAFSGPVVNSWASRALPEAQLRVQGSVHTEREDQAWLAKLGAKDEWLDHLTASVFESGTVVHHIAWPYSDRYCHWLQAAWVPG